MDTSRITSKNQATIPADVRLALAVRAGDSLAWEIRGSEVRVSRAPALDGAFAAAVSGTLVEWSDEADEEAWRDL